MIIWTFPVTSETEPAWEGAALRSWRWVFEAKRWWVGFTEQIQRPGEEWHPGNGYYRADLSRTPSRWHFGFHHVYYDGPHHILWLGPLCLSWMTDKWCLICMPDEDDDTSGAVAEFVESIIGAAMAVSQ